MLNCASVQVSYNNNALFPPISFVVEPGTCTVIMGRSGIGKSSLLNAICGSIAFSGSIVTEKTLMAIFGGTIPIWFGGWRIPDYMRSVGFDVFDDIVDHSYQNLSSPEQRCREAVNKNIHLLKNLTQVDHTRLQHNLNLIKSNLWQTQINNLIETYPDLRTA